MFQRGLIQVVHYFKKSCFFFTVCVQLRPEGKEKGSALLLPHPGDFSSALAHLTVASGLICIYLFIKKDKLIIHSLPYIQQNCDLKLNSEIIVGKLILISLQIEYL